MENAFIIMVLWIFNETCLNAAGRRKIKKNINVLASKCWWNIMYNVLFSELYQIKLIKSYNYFDQNILKGHWTNVTSSSNFFPKKVGIFIPLEVLAWVMTACRVLRSRLIYFLRNMNISSIFYFSKSTSKNTQYSSLWDTLEMMLFTKYFIKWKRIGMKISVKV